MHPLQHIQARWQGPSMRSAVPSAALELAMATMLCMAPLQGMAEQL